MMPGHLTPSVNIASRFAHRCVEDTHLARTDCRAHENSKTIDSQKQKEHYYELCDKTHEHIGVFKL